MIQKKKPFFPHIYLSWCDVCTTWTLLNWLHPRRQKHPFKSDNIILRFYGEILLRKNVRVAFSLSFSQSFYGESLMSANLSVFCAFIIDWDNFLTKNLMLLLSIKIFHRNVDVNQCFVLWNCRIRRNLLVDLLGWLQCCCLKETQFTFNDIFDLLKDLLPTRLLVKWVKIGRVFEWISRIEGLPD